MRHGRRQVRRGTQLAKENPAPKNIDEIAYHRALCAMHLDDFKQAAEEFEQFRRKWADAVEATDSIYRQAYCLYRLKEYDRSLSLCREVAKRPTSSVTTPALELAAENLFLKGNYTDAAKTLQPLLEKAEDKVRSARLTLRIGQCRYYAGDYKQAIDTLKPLAGSEALGKTPDIWEGILLLGDSQLKADQPEAAVATLKKYLTRDTKKQSEARFKLALAQIDARKRDDARETLAELVKADDNNPWVRRGRLQYAQLLYDQDKLKPAAEQLETLLKTDPDKELEAPAMYLAAYIDMQQEQYATAAERFGKLAESYPDFERTPEARFQRGVCLRNEKKFDDARKALEGYLKDHPKGEHATRARYLVGVCLASQDKHKEAIKVFADLAADRDTVSDAVLYKLAWSSREVKDTKTAKAAYRSLLKDYSKGPFATHARAELAGMLYVEKEYAEAADLLEKAVALEDTPEDILPVSLYRLGSCYEKLGKPDKAAEVLDAFMKRFTDHELAPSALYKAAVAMLTEEQSDKAADVLQTLLKRYEKHDLATPALMKLGEARAAAGKYDDAYKTYVSFIKKYPKYDMLYFAQFGAGWAAENRKQYDTAREWYKKVIQSHNGETAARAQFQVGQCYLKEGKYEPAVGELLKVEIVYDYPKWSARALYEAGMTFERDKKYTQARKQYERCVKLFPKSTPAELSAKRLEALKKAGY
ncbi:MAG: tetratricopeptide repeat protein [Phycisphaerae bacterium]